MSFQSNTQGDPVHGTKKVRVAKIALDRKLSGPIIGALSYFFKTPPKQFRDDIYREKVEAFIKGDSND